MKPLYRCEYCDVTGTEEEIREHEEKCIKNYKKKSCFTCKHCATDGVQSVKCKLGIEIEEDKYYENCPKHEVGKPEVKGFMKMFEEMFMKEGDK